MEEKPKNETNEIIDLVDPDEFDEADEANSNNPNPKNEDGTEKTEEQLEKEKEELKAKNAKFAEMRRQKEAAEKAAKEKAEQEAKEAKIRKEAAEQAELGVLKTNPYTEQPIKDGEDLEVYKIQRKLEEEGKDPVKDLPSKLAELNREKKKKVAEDEQKAIDANKHRNEQVLEENRELSEKYPDLNKGELAKDPLFRECMHGRVGRWRLVEIYEYYLEKKKSIETNKREKEIESSQQTLPPSSNANGTPVSKKVSDMTKEEFEAYWKKKYGE